MSSSRIVRFVHTGKPVAHCACSEGEELSMQKSAPGGDFVGIDWRGAAGDLI